MKSDFIMMNMFNIKTADLHNIDLIMDTKKITVQQTLYILCI